MQLILLAAGKGKRLPKELRKKPKSLVEINNKSILDHNINFYNKFKKKIIITGYKSKHLKQFILDHKFIEIKNKNFEKTNMVYSAFCCHNLIKSDVVICYSDIIFDPSIYNILKKKKNLIPVKKNWLKIWKKRMNIKQIKSDAENIIVSENKLVSIGQKITNKNPNCQYMGLVKIKYHSYKNLKNFFNFLKKKNISFTKFIDLSLKKKKIEFDVFYTNKYWYEIDTIKDIKFTEKELW